MECDDSSSLWISKFARIQRWSHFLSVLEKESGDASHTEKAAP
jgi:hypothetical protein